MRAHGRVQGVFFRDTCRRLATSRGVAGWVRNRRDGSVEAVPEHLAERAQSLASGQRLEDLIEAADRLARTYSGGMQRKLDVARGLIHRPRVLFLFTGGVVMDAALGSDHRAVAADETADAGYDDGVLSHRMALPRPGLSKRQAS